MLTDLYDRVSPAMPTDLVATRVFGAIPDDPEAVVNTFNHDEGHAGRYAVPSADDVGGSISSSYVHDREDVFEYIYKQLLYNAPFAPECGNEFNNLCVISPGLNTPLQPGVRDIPAPKRTRFYIAVMQCIPMAQLHLGSSLDQPEVCVNTKGPFGVHILLRQLRKIFDYFSGDNNDEEEDDDEGSSGKHPHCGELDDYVDNIYDASTKTDGSQDDHLADSGKLPNAEEDTTDVAGFVPTVRADGNIVFSSRLIDVIQAGLSEFSLVDTPLKKAYRFLLSQSRPVTLIAYSRSSMEVKAAIHEYISSQKDRDACRKQLLANVTVVTVGAACRFFPDGPAYLHVSSFNDELVALRGVCSARPRGAGANSVFLHCKTPFAKSAADHHNMAVAAAPLLAIALEHNSVASLRSLWELGIKRELKLPPNVDLLVRAMIVLTNGEHMMFNKEKAMKDLPSDIMPSLQDAQLRLQQSLGHDFVNRALACKARFDEWNRDVSQDE